MASPLYNNETLAYRASLPTEFGQTVEPGDAPAVSPEHSQFLANWDPATGPTGDPKDAILDAAKDTLAETAPTAEAFRKIDADTAAANAQNRTQTASDMGRAQVYGDLATTLGMTGAGVALEAAPALPGVPAAAKTLLTNVLGRGASAYEGYKLGGIPGAVAGGLAPEILKTVLPAGITSRLSAALEGLQGAAGSTAEAEAAPALTTEAERMAGESAAGELPDAWKPFAKVAPAANEAAAAEGPVRASSEIRAFGGLGKPQVPTISADDPSLVRESIAKGMNPQTALRTVAGKDPEAQRVLSGLMNAVGDNRLANTVGSQAFDAEQEAAGGIQNPAFKAFAGSPFADRPAEDLISSPGAQDYLQTQFAMNKGFPTDPIGRPLPAPVRAVQGPEADANVNPNLLSPLDRLSRLSRARALGKSFRTNTPLPPEQ